MAGYDLLGDADDIEQAHSIEVLLSPSPDVEVHAFEAGAQNFRYYLQGQMVVITTPMPSYYLSIFLNEVAQNESFQNKNLLVVLNGMGATEEHYVTAHIPPEGKIQIIDSKVSDPKRYFSEYRGSKLWAAITGLYRAIRSRVKTLGALIPGREVEYIPLGTQSYFDGISCGFHAVSNLELCKLLITNSDPINREELLRAQENPVERASLGLMNHPLYKKWADSRLFTFITAAWQETFMPLIAKDERNQRSFRHYFLGWPFEGTFQRVLYVLTLGFVFNPIMSFLKIPFMFLPRVLGEIMHWVRDRVIDWSPKTYLLQTFRSILMLSTYAFEGVFKATSMLLGLILDPKTSIQLSYRIHPALGILTGFIIVGIYLTFAFVAAPAIWNALSPLAASVIKPSIIFLAEPILFLTKSILISTAAACSLFFSAGTLLSIHWALETIASWVDSENSDMQQTRDPPCEDSFEEQEGRSPYGHSELGVSNVRSKELGEVQEIYPSGTLAWGQERLTESTHLLSQGQVLEVQSI